MGSVISIALPSEGLISGCLDCVAGQVVLGCNLEENVESLEYEWDLLRDKKNDMQIRVNREEGPEMRRLHEVEGWMVKVTLMEVVIEELIKNSRTEINKQVCCIGCCAKSSITRRSLEKKVTRVLQQVSELKSRGEFASVVHRVAPNPLASRNSEPTVGLETYIDEVWGYINDDRVGVIGLYGMGGVGKTTLLTEINNKFSKETHAFNTVIWVPVSNDSNIDTIQHDIGKKIGYHKNIWAGKNQAEKAEDIFLVLSQKKFVLLLDDIKVSLDLKVVGVPLQNSQIKSKVIFTTRSLVVCGQMDAQKKVEVKCLGTDEAWELFKSKVREDRLYGHPDILDVAKLVVKECGGLPLALNVIGNVMASKSTPEEWLFELSVLKENGSKFTDLEDKVFGVLKLSYDNLPSDIERQCLLYCSLFPTNYYIPKQKLINYWFGEAFLEDYHHFDHARLKGYSIIGTLINACLLEEDKNDGVKMHDVIRDMSLWLTSNSEKGTRKYLEQARAGLTELPFGIYEIGVERISLTGNCIEELPDLPKCHNLFTLLLNDNCLNWISLGFFGSMCSLKVLDLSGNKGLTELPVDISSLVSVQYLNLSATGITELPMELGSLISLKYLDLTYMNHLHIIPDGLLSNLKRLKVLKMFGCGSSDLRTQTSSFWGRQESLLREIQVLRNLDQLCITIRTTSYLIPFLQSCNMCITRLGLSHLKLTDHFYWTCIGKLERLERLEITDCEFGVSGRPMDLYFLFPFPKLRFLFIVRCSNFRKFIFTEREINLKLLLVAYCQDVTNIFYEEAPKLEEVYLIELPKLSHIASMDMNWLQLRYIGVEGCPNLKGLPFNSRHELTIQGSEEWWNSLIHKPDTSFCLMDSNEKDKKKDESSISAPGPLKFIPGIKDKIVPESSSYTFDPDTYLPHFMTFD